MSEETKNLNDAELSGALRKVMDCVSGIEIRDHWLTNASKIGGVLSDLNIVAENLEARADGNKAD